MSLPVSSLISGLTVTGEFFLGASRVVSRSKPSKNPPWIKFRKLNWKCSYNKINVKEWLLITYTYSGKPVNAVFTVFQLFCPWPNTQKISKSGSLYSTDNFFYNIVVSTVNLPFSKNTKCKDLAVAYKNQTTGTPFLEKWRESVEISESIIGNNRIAATDRSSIIIGKIYQ